MMDPAQLQMMQQMGVMSSQFGLPGFFNPSAGGGIGLLLQTAGSYASPIAGNRYPSTLPLAPLGLENYGLIGALASMAGNTYMSNMFYQQGVLPLGNAGSFMQAQRANQHLRMQRSVAEEVAPQDADAYYQTIKGMAALTGQPFNREQRTAARNLSKTLAQFGPNIALFRPDILDAFAGETGSVQAMATQMMEANRYRIDPYTGQIGYGKDANADLINKLFDTLYSKDSMAQMNGIRAGEAGQLYNELADRGLLTQQGSLRERTLDALYRAKDTGQLEKIGAAAGVDVSGNLESLKFEDLDKLRQTSGLQKLLTSADVNNIKQQLRGYSESLAAIREVFGENGNPNAPIPQLIGALEALTSGQMHKFDAAKLNLMVRDMQSLSQMSGKSIDQMLAMNQSNTGYLQQMGLGPHSAIFAPTATNAGVVHGMAFAEQGGATGFGALNREGAEQAAGRLFARGMASEAGNLYQTLGRINQAGGFDETTAAGRKLKAIHDAAYAQQTTYVDPETGETKTLPMRENEIRGLIGQGAAKGLGLEDFNMMLSDRTSNLRIAAEDKNYQTIATNMQAVEYMRKERKDASYRISSSAALRDIEPAKRQTVAMEMTTAAQEALNTLSPQEQNDRNLRQRVMSEAIKREALNNGVAMSDDEARNMAESMYGQFENTSVKFGFDSRTATAQMLGPQVVEARNRKTSQAAARSQMNQAMSSLGPKGTVTQRLFSAIQKQGERGDEATLDTFLIDMFGVENMEVRERLVPEMQATANEQAAIEKLSLKLEDPKLSTAERAEISREIKKRTAALEQHNIEIRETARSMGLDSGEGSFGRDDVIKAREAARNLEHLNRTDQSRILALEGPVTKTEREKLGERRITQEDVIAVAESRRKREVEKIDNLTAEDIETYSTKVDEIEKLQKQLDEGGVDEGWLDFTGLDPSDREAIQRKIDQKHEELVQLSPQLQEQYVTFRKTYDEKTAVSMIRDRLKEQVGTTEEVANNVIREFGSAVVQINQLSEADQDAIVRSRRADEASTPTAAEIKQRASALRAELGLQEEDLSTEDLVKRLSKSNQFETGLRRIKQALQEEVVDGSRLTVDTEATMDSVREGLADIGETDELELSPEARTRRMVQRAQEIAAKSGIEVEGERIRFEARGGVPVEIEGEFVDPDALTRRELENVVGALDLKQSMSGLDEREQRLMQRFAPALQRKIEESGLTVEQQEMLATEVNAEAATLTPEELQDPERQQEVISRAINRAQEHGLDLSELQRAEVVRQIRRSVFQQATTEPPSLQETVRDELVDAEFLELEELTQEQKDLIAQELLPGVEKLTPEELRNEDQQRTVLAEAITRAEEKGLSLPEEQRDRIIEQLQKSVFKKEAIEPPSFATLIESGLRDVDFLTAPPLSREQQNMLAQELTPLVERLSTEELADTTRQREVVFEAIQRAEQKGFTLPAAEKEKLVQQLQQSVFEAEERKPPDFGKLIKSGLGEVQFLAAGQFTREQQDLIAQSLDESYQQLTPEELANEDRQREVVFEAIAKAEEKGLTLPAEQREELAQRLQRSVFAREERERPSFQEMVRTGLREVDFAEAEKLTQEQQALITDELEPLVNAMGPRESQTKEEQVKVIERALANAETKGLVIPEARKEQLVQQLRQSVFYSDDAAVPTRERIEAGLQRVEFEAPGVTQLTEEQQNLITEQLEPLVTGLKPEELQDAERRQEVITEALSNAEKAGLTLQAEQKEVVTKQLDYYLAEAGKSDKDIKRRQTQLSEDLSTTAVNTLLQLTPEELRSEEDTVRAVADAIVADAEERGVAISREDAIQYAQNTTQRARTVAKTYGYDSLEQFVASAPVEGADNLRKEIQRREELAGDQTRLAEHQLLAEGQLRALGQLSKDENLMASREEIMKFKSMDEPLKKSLAEAPIEERAEIVDRYIDAKVAETFYGTPEEIEEKRQRQLEYLQSSEGERRIEEVRDSLETMTDLRRELQLDPEAVKRLGAARAVEAVKRSRSAEMKLQEMANRYGFNGSVEAMIASEFTASDAEGMDTIQQEFSELSDDQKQQVVDRLRAEGITVSKDKLAVSDYRNYLRHQMKDQLGELRSANEAMLGATSDKERAKELGVTENQFKSLQSLSRMEQEVEKDSEESAKQLGMSEDRYWQMVTGSADFDESLKLFKGEDATKQLSEAKASEENILKAQKKLDSVEAAIATAENAGGTPSEALLEKRETLLQQIATETAARDTRMREAGLDPTKEEDVKRYKTLLDNQGTVSQLEERRKNYAAIREDLRKEGLSEEEIDSRVDQMIANDKAAMEKMEEFKKQDITESDLKLAEAFGIDTSESNEKLTEFKQMLKESGGTGEASKRTQDMIAETLEDVSKIQGLKGEDALEKLDTLSDEYRETSPADRKKLAKKYGLEVEELDRMMKRTEKVFDFEDTDVSKLDDTKKQEMLSEGLKRVMGRDIAAEVKSEEERQMKLTGTVNLTGVVQGEGTFEDVTGNTVR